MTAILGISAFYHDSAAALVVDGTIVAAAQEERFTRNKHDSAFPKHAIDYCLSQAGITPSDLDHVGFYEKPLLKFDRLLETYLSFAPIGFQSFLKAMPQWVGQKLHLRREIRRGLRDQFNRRICFCEHHESHAASAFFPSPFDEAAILTMDGVGEWATTSLGVGRGNHIELNEEIRFPHSIGLLYSAFTYYTGFRVNSGEYKLMGLAPYGQPIYADAIRENLIEIRDDGSFCLNLEYFNYCQGLTMTSESFHQLFDRSPRAPDSPIEQLDMDLAASVQAVTEEVVLKTASHLHQTTGMKNLCMAGGVALNCVANGKLVTDGPFDNVWIQPAAGDAGGALGVAMLIWHQLLDKPRTAMMPDAQSGSLLGPAYSHDEIETTLKQLDADFHHYYDESQLVDAVAEELAAGKVVGRFQGRMEFGPRALGNRSILGDPRSREMQSVMNLKIKFRESFRPFAPIVLADHARDYFQLPATCESPYMLLVFGVADEHRVASNVDDRSTPAIGLQRVNEVRSSVPAITHVDYSARVQTVDAKRNPSIEKLLRAFHAKTGCPLLINTSFNVRGEPIVCTPEDAYRCFMATNMDVLVLENFVLKKTSQRHATQHEVDAHLAQFDPD
ncbi:MAG: carbamoyltransferase [Pirellulaceae bacterium]|nr:carbamoyltransferase [Pirellulaceae bacterium]